MALNILEKAVHSIKKAFEELEGQAGNMTLIRDKARELRKVVEPVNDVVLKMGGELKCISLGRIPDMLEEAAEMPEEEYNKFIRAVLGRDIPV